VFGASPVIKLANVPLPDPLVVWLPAMVGFDEVLQQTPLAIIAKPPADEILPPIKAVVAVTELAVVVFMVGKSDTGPGSFFWQLKEIKANKRIRYECFMQG